MHVTAAVISDAVCVEVAVYFILLRIHAKDLFIGTA
jgi:hypothetical protein